MFDSLLAVYDSIIFVDTETTGFDSETDHITEFAAIKVTPSAPEVRFSTLIQLPTGVTIPDALITMTGITDDMCKTGISPAELYNRFSSLLEPHTLIVAYNAQFDVSFLKRLEKEYGEMGGGGVDYLDALTVYRDRAEAPHKLSDAIRHYNVEGRNSHRAMEDAEALLNVTQAMAEEKDNLPEYINRFGYKRKYGISGGRIEGIEYFEQLE